ncbi:heterokaryon incompatibility protein-domain-containing protein, partial [Cercophora newfieldiana]
MIAATGACDDTIHKTSFSYQPLDETKREIRLLTICDPKKRACTSRLIHCEINHVSLNDRPSYKAVSYVWGDPDAARPIIVNSALWHVAENLYQFLCQFQYQESVGPLWIDALCINQEDVKEKSLQVQRMKGVYDQSSEVLAWLGICTNGTCMDIGHGAHPGFAHLDRLGGGEIAQSSIFSFNSEDYHPGGRATVWLESELVDDRTDLTAISEVFEHPIFTRAWCLQELAQPSLTLVWGNHTLNGRNLFAIWEVLYQYMSVRLPPSAMRRPASWNRLRLALKGASSAVSAMRPGRRSRTLVQWVVTTQYYVYTTDPRDRIFAFLGLASDNMGIVADYSLGCVEAYKHVARAIFEASGLSRLLFYARSMLKNQPGLPSFVPDWSVQTRPFQVWYYPSHTRSLFKAAVADGIVAVLDPAVTKLKVRGFVIDRVSNTTRQHNIAGEGLVVRIHKTNQWISDLEDVARPVLDSCCNETTRDLFRDRVMNTVLSTSFSPLWSKDDGGAALASECYRIVRKFATREELPMQLLEGELTADELQCLAGGLRFEAAARSSGMKGFVTEGGFVGVANPPVEVGDLV